MNQIVLEILNWYKNNYRNLPWRNTDDPYKIWLSEIILQQTQVKQGLDYYSKFIENFPTVKHLALANEEEVLKLWQGLGYYSRARNLHKTAGIILNEYKGEFPDNYSDLLKLPGIGDYTASAIASFAFNKPYPVLDGNVFRFISRLFNIHLAIDEQENRKTFMAILYEMIEEHNPALFNNAMMEMGAIICKPNNPDCSNCAVSRYCQALKLGKVNSLPIKVKKTKIKTRYMNFILIEYKKGFYLEKRTSKDIWQNLFQLPLIETKSMTDISGIKEVMKTIMNTKETFRIVQQFKVKHLLTHQVLEAEFWSVKLKNEPVFTNKKMVYTNWSEYKNYPIPKLIENYLVLL